MKKVLMIVIVLALLGGGAYLIFGRKKDSTMPDMQGTATGNPTSSANTATPTNSVNISNFAFSPSSISVKKGTTVTWTNNDAAAHTVTGDSSDGPKSGVLKNGQTYSFTFTKAGTFSYHCNIHGSMIGTVTVTE